MSNSTLLPPNATPTESALDGAASRISDVPMAVRASWDPDTCPSALLPWLAWAFAVDEWNAKWTDAQKRAAINASVYIHRHKGTAGALRKALNALGLNLTLTEWWQETPPGNPYTFGIEVTVDQVGIPDLAGINSIISVANNTKNLRSHMTGLQITAISGANLFAGAATVCSETVTISGA